MIQALASGAFLYSQPDFWTNLQTLHMEKGYIKSCKDLGAAGLGGASAELAAKGGLGAYIIADAVTQREPNMNAYEILLAESQERMFAGFNENSQIVWFKIIYSKEPGSLSLITDFLEKENAFIMFGHLDNITQKTGEYSVFTELNKDVDPEAFAQKIKELKVVSEVEYGISEYGMVYSVDFPLNVIGVRGVMARALTIVDIIKTLNQSAPHVHPA